MSGRIDSSVDATRGQPLAARVIARKNELEDALAERGQLDAHEQAEIETALATVYLLIGGLAHPSPAVAGNLNRWLERNKYLAQGITRRQNAIRLAQQQAREQAA